ncbi:MAG: sensor histidine kinase [Nocardioidaceae bacterium]
MALPDGGGTALTTARGQLLGAEQTGRSALDELRRLLGVLRDPDPRPPRTLGDPATLLPSTEPLPSLVDVAPLVHDFRRRGLEIRLSPDVALHDVEPGLGLTAYRVVDEGLTNALKHAPGSEVSVDVRGTADRLRIEVIDRGGAQVAGPGTGFGLLGLRERVALYGGRLQAGPTEDGWRLVVELPRRQSEHAADRLPASPVVSEQVTEQAIR